MSRPSLHSTMFLLIPGEVADGTPVSVFTFHDVSINTGKQIRHCRAVNVLYIPRCFY